MKGGTWPDGIKLSGDVSNPNWPYLRNLFRYDQKWERPCALFSSASGLRTIVMLLAAMRQNRFLSLFSFITVSVAVHCQRSTRLCCCGNMGRVNAAGRARRNCLFPPRLLTDIRERNVGTKRCETLRTPKERGDWARLDSNEKSAHLPVAHAGHTYKLIIKIYGEWRWT